MKFIFIFFLLGINLYANQQVLNELVYTIRDPETKAAKFRESLEKIGEYLALDALDALDKSQETIQTLTGSSATHLLVEETPVLVTILRAGLPLNAGVQKVFPNAAIGFFAMSRNEETLKAKIDYIALPEIKDKTVILTDTMLATGGSLLDAIKTIEKYHPKRIWVITAIASQPGINRVLNQYPDILIFAAAIDPLLNDKGYIVPGLGDAGDRAYGDKISTFPDPML